LHSTGEEFGTSMEPWLAAELPGTGQVIKSWD
jgi:hypothetical protein